MTTVEALLLGLVQGLTEFVPISSKTHLVVVPALLGVDPPGLAFIVMLHLGTLVALLVYFGRDLAGFAADLPRPGSEGRRTVTMLAVGSLPAAVAGLLLADTVEDLLSHPAPVAFSLLATAALLAGAEWRARTFGRRSLTAKPLRDAVLWRDAVGMGFAQAVALFPGVSRSGSTMAGGLSLGLGRDAAARFSFLLAIPAIAGANALELPGLIREGVGAPEVAGFLAAAVSGYLSMAVLLRYLRTHNFLPFAAYCLVFALVSGSILS